MSFRKQTVGSMTHESEKNMTGEKRERGLLHCPVQGVRTDRHNHTGRTDDTRSAWWRSENEPEEHVSSEMRKHLNGPMRKLQGGFEEMKITDLMFRHTKFEIPAEMCARSS